ncbi:MAG: phosphate ABC transporter permease subunit PstC [Candidatus Palauibacterales bacterium]|jgi:phosphate transport system permease protein|nr:phosphate ABC transporter permease subunit PstC [Candidatus Palauibacterales bacterium]MDP2482466.1 phosphate ABC transporter permease subunit PstC [Candidatus Palauibacterales bacterium]
MTHSEAAITSGPGSAPPAGGALRSPAALDLGYRMGRRWGERLIAALLFGCGLISVLTTVGIVVVLVTESAGFFREVPIAEFLTGTRWSPMYSEQHFGILPLLNGTLLIAAGSMLVALPVGLTSAIYLSEYAAPRTRAVIKPILEVLAGIPTVVYGYFALTFVTPLIRMAFPGTGIFNAASGAIVVGIMIIPMVASLSEDALNAVPLSLREAAYGLGATKFEVSTRVVVPSALSGIVASFILAISRAVGETMAVTLAAGATPKMTLNFLESIQTMTAYIVQVSLGETPHGTLEYRTIFAVGLVLFLITLVMNLLSQRITRRFREEYE